MFLQTVLMHGRYRQASFQCFAGHFLIRTSLFLSLSQAFVTWPLSGEIRQGKEERFWTHGLPSSSRDASVLNVEMNVCEVDL